MSRFIHFHGVESIAGVVVGGIILFASGVAVGQPVGKDADVRALIARLKDKDETVRLKAAKELGKLKAREAIAALVIATKDTDKDVSAAAVKSLVAIKEALVKDLRAKDPKVRVAAANGLKAIGEDADDAGGALCLATLDPAAAVREAALEAIEKVRPALYKNVVVLAVEADRGKRFQAIEALRKLEERALPAVPLVLRELKAELVESRGATYYRIPLTFLAAVKAKDSETIKTIAAGAIGAAIPDGRIACLDALLNLSADNDDLRKQAFQVFQRAIGDTESQVAVTAINAIPKFEKRAKAMLPTLKKLKLSTDEKIREAATKAVSEIEG